jgi:hypothetical protein
VHSRQKSRRCALVKIHADALSSKITPF